MKLYNFLIKNIVFFVYRAYIDRDLVIYFLFLKKCSLSVSKRMSRFLKNIYGYSGKKKKECHI